MGLVIGVRRTTTSVKMPVMARAVSASSVMFAATIPPKALTGSAAGMLPGGEIRRRGDAAGVGMLDDGDRRVGEFGGKLERRVSVVQIVVGQRLALKLCCGGDARPCLAAGIERGALVRVLAIAELLEASARQCHGLAELLAGKPSGNGPVIGRRAGEYPPASRRRVPVATPPPASSASTSV